MTSRTKLIAIAVVAVMLPTTVISGLQYNSLIDLERQTRMAAHENLRQAATSLSTRTAEHIRELGLKAIADVPNDRLSYPEQAAQIQRRFKQALDSNPAIESIFIIAECSCNYSTGSAIIQTRNGVHQVSGKSVASDHEVRHLVSLRQKAGAAAAELPPSQRYGLFAFEPACEKFTFQSYAFFPLTDSRGSQNGFTGIKLNSQRLLDDFIPEVLPSFIDGDIGLSIIDDMDRQVFTNSGHDSHEFQMSFGPVFPQWQIGLDYKAASIEELAQSNFRQSMMLSGFVMLLLVAGITLTLRAAAREMRLAEAKSSFVSNVSHELKTPLALIRLFAETLELGRVKSPEKAHEYYRIINNESTRLTQLINNILDFSKIEAGRKDYAFEAADVGQVVEDVIRSYEYPIRNEGFDLRTSIAAGLPAVNLDRGAISQAVLNLLNNAVKYSDSIKQIDVAVRREPDHVAIEVSDKGIGIPSSEQHRIFDKFYRISHGLVHDRKGTGLGLTLVKHIVDAHHGEIRMDSTPGSGSRFTVLLPICNDHSAAAPALAYESSHYRG